MHTQPGLIQLHARTCSVITPISLTTTTTANINLGVLAGEQTPELGKKIQAIAKQGLDKDGNHLGGSRGGSSSE